MQWLRDLPISRKFTFAFGIVCFLCVVLGAYTFVIFRGIAAKSADVSEVSFPTLVHLANIRGAMLQYRREDLNILLCPTPACVAVHLAKQQNALSTFNEASSTYEPLIRTSQDRLAFQDMSAAFAAYRGASVQAVGLAEAADKRCDRSSAIRSQHSQNQRSDRIRVSSNER